MARYLPETRPVTVGSDRHEVKDKRFLDEKGRLVVHVRNRVSEGIEDYLGTFAGGSEDRGTEYLNTHLVADQNVDVRNEIEGLTPNDGETPEAFQARLETAAQAVIDSWTAEKTRRVGTGTTSKARAVDELSEMVAAGRPQAEINAKVAEMAARFGVAKKK